MQHVFRLERYLDDSLRSRIVVLGYTVVGMDDSTVYAIGEDNHIRRFVKDCSLFEDFFAADRERARVQQEDDCVHRG